MSLRDKKNAEELAAAIAAKPPTPAFMKKPPVESNPNYVPPPVVNLQAQVEGRRRRSTEEIEQTRIISNQETVESLKLDIARDTQRAEAGATTEAEEASRAETIRLIQASIRRADSLAGRKSQAELVQEARDADARVHVENLTLIKAEMARSIHTEDYSSG